MVLDRAKTTRGALAGAVAAGVWAAQQPLDKPVFGVDYDDVELLGKAFTRGPAWPVAGTAIHLANGALVGAAYASLAPRLPLPSWSRGPLVALAEHVEDLHPQIRERAVQLVEERDDLRLAGVLEGAQDVHLGVVGVPGALRVRVPPDRREVLAHQLGGGG